MANELTLSLAVALSNGHLKKNYNASGLRVTQAAIGSYESVVNVGTSEEDIATGDIGTLGWLIMRNLDTANYVTYGPKSTTMVAFGRIEAGEFAAMRLEPGITITAQANTGAVKLQMWFLED